MTTNTRGILTKKAYDLISNKIITLELKPGEKVSEKTFEHSLGIGRTPIREALLKLKQEHLITVIPQSGTYVAKINLKMVKESCFVRTGIERIIMHQAAEKTFNQTQIATLNNILQSQLAAFENADYPLFFKYSDQFYEYFYTLTDHTLVWEWLRHLNMAFKRFRYLQIKVNGPSCREILSYQQQQFKMVINHDLPTIDQFAAKTSFLQQQNVEQVLTAFPTYFTNIK